MDSHPDKTVTFLTAFLTKNKNPNTTKVLGLHNLKTEVNKDILFCQMGEIIQAFLSLGRFLFHSSAEAYLIPR